MSEQPCHVACYAFATGREVHHVDFGWRPGWHYWVEEVRYRISDLSDPRWLADVLTGLTGLTDKKRHFTRISIELVDGLDPEHDGEILAHLIGRRFNLRGYGPDLPSALCAAIAKAREAGNG